MLAGALLVGLKVFTLEKRRARSKVILTIFFLILKTHLMPQGVKEMSDDKRLDEIAEHLSSADKLNYLHACRSGHPLNNPYQWRNLLWNTSAIPNLPHKDWLADKAREEAK